MEFEPENRWGELIEFISGIFYRVEESCQLSQLQLLLSTHSRVVNPYKHTLELHWAESAHSIANAVGVNANTGCVPDFV
jgi:hypothetical protein